jgi:hypothetical protein
MTNKNTIEFEATIAGMELMAAFIAQFVREGIIYFVRDCGKTFEVTTTGGF